MQLINNRYKINSVYKVYDHGTMYMVHDLWSENKNLLLKLFNNDSSNYSLFREFTDTFIELRSLRHRCLIPNYSFDIVSSIDNKPIKIKNYFYTMDFVRGTKLNKLIGKMSIDQILSIIYQLLELASYLEFRGYTYKYINIDNIFVVDDCRDSLIKLVDFATISERIIKNFYNEDYNVFTSPEVRMKQNNVGVWSDIYSIGMVFKSMLSGSLSRIEEKDFEIADYLGLSQEQKNDIKNLIIKLTDKNHEVRIRNINEIAKEINYIFNRDYKLNLKEERNILNFGGCIVGRDNEVESILDYDNKLESRIIDKQIMSFTGEEGIGKTRLLKELTYRLKMKGRTVYHTSVSDSNSKELGPIIKILKNMIKECDNKLIDVYGCELVKIIPEISESRNIKPSALLSGTKERLRLYDRITKFIIDSIKNTPTYIVIDDIHNADIETINLINYLVNSSEQVPLMLIISYNKDLVNRKKAIRDTVNSWINQGKASEHKLLRLSLDETAELVKNILGMSYKPINFSTKVMNDTLGNPGHVEEAIKNLVATGELFINENGRWDAPTNNYTSLYIPPNIEDAVKRQVKLLDKELFDTAKYISIFNTSISKNIIKKMAEGHNIDTDTAIDKLVSMKILDQRVEDWGFTYDFYNRHIKTFIYSYISEEEKLELHSKAAEILESIYTEQDRGNIDELIYHYNMSRQTSKAIKQTIMNAKKMKGLIGNIQCIHLWENAYQLIENREDEDKLEVLSNLGNLYLLQGMTGKSINSYEEGLNIAKKLKNKKYIAICNNGLSSAFYRKYDIDLAQKYADEAKTIAEDNGFIEELLEAIKAINRIELSKGEYDKVFERSNKYLNIAKEHGFELYLGHFYNQMGISKAFTSQIESARDYFLISLDYFQKSGDYVESARALNNIGFIYAEFSDDLDTAMTYYEEGLSISRKFQSLESEAVFLNNIGELYMRSYNYEKAQEYIEKMESISREIEDENLLFLSQVNLGIIYLSMGKYDKCFIYYEKANETFNKGFVEEQDIIRYYYFLSNFYLTFGDYDKANEYINKIMNSSSQVENVIKLEVRLMEILIKFWTYNTIDKDEIDNLMAQYRLSKYFAERRKALLILAFMSVIAGNIEIAEELLIEDDEIENAFTLDYLKLLKSIVVGKIKRDYHILANGYEKIKNKGHYEVEYFTNIELGDICFNNNQLYKSVNYYLTALDLLYRLAKKIPDKRKQVKFINRHRASEVLDKLMRVVSDVKGDKVLYSQPQNFDETMELEHYFNIKHIVDLFNEDIFNTEYREEQQYQKQIAKTFEDLILSLDSNYMSNLNTILNYAVSKTFASRGMIIVHDFETDQLITVASTSQNIFISDKDLILTEVRQKNRGIIINKSFNYEEQDRMLNIDDSIKAMICMPIFKLQTLQNEMEIDRRKKKYINNYRDIIGYLYLDTDKLFNRFDSKRFKLIDAISHLISINIDNYLLKIISSTDKLTGVYTRKFFDNTFKEIIKIARRDGIEFSVIMIDIDKFKNVNDTFGHRKGDMILGEIGKIISENVRRSDIVGRYGGEEFIVILPNTTIKEGEIVAEKIRKAVESSNLISENYPITISLGISAFPEHGHTEEELIEKADQASYVAKETGRNKCVIWSNDVGKSRKRLDKLAGIITGNTVKDQRTGLVIVEIIDLIKEEISKEEKIYKILGRIIEALEAEQGIIVTLDENNKIHNSYGRIRFSDTWLENVEYNHKVIYKVIEEQSGEFFIDWEDIREIDLVSGKPNWKSVIVVPLINSGVVKGVLQISVPIKEKEFDYNSFNFVNTIGGIIAAML